MPTRFQFRSYLTYWLDAVDSHSLHSPFFYDLYTRVVLPARSASNHAPYERLREKLLQNSMSIEVTDLGAGSVHGNGSQRKVKDIARTALSPRKMSNLYAQIISYYRYRNIIELGTSLGVNTLYLASCKDANVTTFEGAPGIAEIARDTFAFAEANNIRLIEGNIDRTLSDFIGRSPKIDLAFVDANHRYEPTIRYFRQIATRINTTGMIIIDDIHYSAEMERAWNELTLHPLVHGSADLYRAGILLFDPSLNKQHVVLQY